MAGDFDVDLTTDRDWSAVNAVVSDNGEYLSSSTYADAFDISRSDGVITRTIDFLNASLPSSFKIPAINGCKTGPSSALFTMDPAVDDPEAILLIDDGTLTQAGTKARALVDQIAERVQPNLLSATDESLDDSATSREVVDRSFSPDIGFMAEL